MKTEPASAPWRAPFAIAVIRRHCRGDLSRRETCDDPHLTVYPLPSRQTPKAFLKSLFFCANC